MTRAASASYGSVVLPGGAAAARLIVCERSGGWAVAMRRELARISHQHPTFDHRVPLLRRSSAGRAPPSLLALRQAVAHCGEKCGLAAAGLRVYETRRLAACWEMLGEAPASFAIVELSAGEVAVLLRQMGRLERDFPLARVAVVADRSWADYEWLMREAGAVDFTCSPRQLGPLARLASRHLAEAPAPQRALTEQIWSDLPWAPQS